jgi:dUTP pyrophosphatase
MSQLKVKIKKLHKNSKLPVKGSGEAACYDVYATSVDVQYGKEVSYGLGFSTEIPFGWKGIIVPRSNLTKHRWMMVNSPAQIDCDYRGEWIVKMTAMEKELQPLPYAIGDRVAQIYFEKVNEVEFEEVEELQPTVRGEGGFGSTGIS